MKLIDWIAYGGMFLVVMLYMILLRGIIGLSKWVSIVVSIPPGAASAVVAGVILLRVYDLFERPRNGRGKEGK